MTAKEISAGQKKLNELSMENLNSLKKDLQQRVDEKHQQFEAFKTDMEFEKAEQERLK